MTRTRNPVFPAVMSLAAGGLATLSLALLLMMMARPAWAASTTKSQATKAEPSNVSPGKTEPGKPEPGKPEPGKPSVAAEPATKAATEYWVAVGYGGRRMVSLDGKSWKITAEWKENGGDDSDLLMGAAVGHGKIVVVGGGGWGRDSQAGHILVSTDGETWRSVLQLPNRVNPIVFGDDKFLAGGPPDKTLYVSADGEKWEPGARLPFESWALWFRHGGYGNGTFVMMGECTPKKEKYWALATRDGKTLTKFRDDMPHLSALAFGAGRFVAVGKGGVVATSADGVDWTKDTVGSDQSLRWIVWTGKEFLAGGGKTVYTSPDGKTWKPHSLPPRGRLLWSDGARFIATSWPGTMHFSPDGKTWVDSPAMTPNGITKVVHVKPLPSRPPGAVGIQTLRE